MERSAQWAALMSADPATPEPFEVLYSIESLVVPRPERATYRPMADQAPQQSTLTTAPPILAPGPHLIVFIQGGVKAHPLKPGQVVTVGRSTDSEIRIDTPSISRRHFTIREGAPSLIEDLASANGTRLNGVRLLANTPTPFEIGNLIEAGGIFFMVQDHGPSTEQMTARIEKSTAPDEESTSIQAMVVVEDVAMARIHGLVELVARSGIPVLVMGETGVGKEVISAALHKRSPRAEKPYIKLNCAALPEALLESELFGYERGAFTGANQTKAGLIEAAHQGTFFLDEIGEMPLPTQAKLLRVLENGELMRLGGLKPRIVDVRFIAATNRNLPSLVAKGAFRRDLYFRLNGITIPIPPLRERKSEIPALASFFLGQAAMRVGRVVPKLTADLIAVLEKHSWPGNIRELKNVMDRALTVCVGGTLLPEHLIIEPDLSLDEAPQSVRRPAPSRPASTPNMSAVTLPAKEPHGRLMRMDSETEQKLILKALDQAGGNQSRASEILGISRRTLINRLDEYGLRRPRKKTEP